MKCPRPTLATHFLKLGGAAFFLIFAAFPRAATAQSVTATITASPNPYHTDDDITLDVEGDWDSETSNWPCDMDWEDGGCAPTMHTFYVYGSNGFFDNWSEDDDLASTGWDDAELTDTGSIGDPLPYGSSISDYEAWTDPYPVVDYRGGINSGWDMPVANGVNGSSATDSYSHIVDQLGINGHQAPMTWDPAVSCSLTAAVDHWGQNWYVAGILVLHDTLFRFQDHEEADQ